MSHKKNSKAHLITQYSVNKQAQSIMIQKQLANKILTLMKSVTYLKQKMKSNKMTKDKIFNQNRPVFQRSTLLDRPQTVFSDQLK